MTTKYIGVGIALGTGVWVALGASIGLALGVAFGGMEPSK